ncbi:alpha/beta fold hydrolase [Microvirga lenta]|uniref:alpha/beta fold hydrolase n=1 Tax=Microvirga lenta TaxID=2881337 RepID=UPI001CFDCBA1|nr:alpha/beta fold hydrolase [Microvirga lenta]MCB5174214.1 alpha/beta fold hydrolase [Microvirga lenta]
MRVSANGAEFRVLIDGPEEKPWLTCLHSLATRAELWDDQIAELTKTFRVLRIDARGHGRSEPVEGPYSFDQLAKDVVAIWDRLGIERSAVLGLSMGGMTAFGLALDHTSRVTRIVAADCRSDAPDFFRNMWTDRQKILHEKGMEAIAEITIPSWLTEETRNTRPDRVERVRGMILETSREGYIGATEALRALNYKDRLSEIRCPTCLVVGAADGPHPTEMRSMAERIPGVRFIEIPAAAHLANVENPEAFNKTVCSFLSE